MDSDAPLEATTPVGELPQLVKLVQGLQEQFDQKIQYDATKDRLLDTLYTDLQDQREGLHWRILRPIFTDLISFHDDISKSIKTLAERERSPEMERFAQLLTTFQITIEEVLARNGVETFSCPDASFVVKKQRAVATRDTNDPALNATIAQRLRKGFIYEDRVLRPEWVEIFQFNGSVDV